MRVENLHHKELLELDPEGGVIHFAGQRALLLEVPQKKAVRLTAERLTKFLTGGGSQW